MKTLAVFDFDHTLTTSDSYTAFLKYYTGTVKYYLNLLILSPILVLFLMKVIPNHKAKTIMTRRFLRNQRKDTVLEIAEKFSKDALPRILRQEAVNKLQYHISQGHEVIVISASYEPWVECWCKTYSIASICTILECHNGLVTGDMVGKNCYGPEKLERLKKIKDLDSYERIFAYGDSRGDREILAIATDPFYRRF